MSVAGVTTERLLAEIAWREITNEISSYRQNHDVPISEPLVFCRDDFDCHAQSKG